MKAVLVYWSPCVRLIVPDDTTEEEAIDLARDEFRECLISEYLPNIEEVKDDTECPYDPEFDNV
jgi:hypothetical protein